VSSAGDRERSCPGERARTIIRAAMSGVGPGSRLGPYELVALAGAGGMGEVYKARDTRLDRTVAIKILPAPLASDAEFRERFDREARVISQLDHPHICTLHDVGEAEEVRFLVMQYLEGETLADRLSRGPLPLEETLQIATQIAGALDCAHGSGVVHRDLKPGNVMLTPAGVKLLDFGLAKTTPVVGHRFSGAVISGSPNLTAGPTISNPVTAQGTILGTFQYMAPEQIEGHEADARTDIFAFGCVLYEMLTGKKAFEGKTQASLLAAILERTPVPVPILQPVTPPAVAHVVDDCLQKNPARRWSSMHDVALELAWIAEEDDSLAGNAAATAPAPKSRTRSIATAAIAAAAVLASAVAAWILKPAPTIAHDVSRFAIALPEGVNFTRAGRHLVAISPDGRKVVFVANQQLYLRSLDQSEAVPIRGTNIDPADPVFAPDGAWVAFWSNNQIRKIALSGGAPVTVCDTPIPYGMHWSGDRIFIGLGPRGIVAVPSAGGTAAQVVAPGTGGELAAHPHLLPDGDSLLFTWRTKGNWNDAQVVVESLRTHARKVIVEGGSDARYVSSGYLVYQHDNVLFAEAFDPRQLSARSGPIAALEDVSGVGSNSGPIGAAQAAISAAGTIAFVPGNASSGRRFVWVDRSGRDEPVAVPPHVYYYPRLSPDGTRLAVDARDQEGDIWVWDFGRSTLTRLTFGSNLESYPAWTPDGRRLLYDSDQGGRLQTYWKAADGSGVAEQLTSGTQSLTPYAVSPDGRHVVLRGSAADGSGSDIYVLALAGDRKPQPLIKTPASELNAELSRDGRWLAYQSNESSRDEVYVRPFPSVGEGRWQISTNGGRTPLWSHDGREIFYVAADNRMMAVSLDTKTVFAAGEARALFDAAKYVTSTLGRAYDIARDDKRFLMTTSAIPAGEANRIAVVQNWLEELKQRVPAK
jgi:eukaryotic-like serine/threonine-protein kinase